MKVDEDVVKRLRPSLLPLRCEYNVFVVISVALHLDIIYISKATELYVQLINTGKSVTMPENNRLIISRITSWIIDVNLHDYYTFGHYPSSCLSFKTLLNSIGLSVPHRKHYVSATRPTG
jgi:hypothetical protein